MPVSLPGILSPLSASLSASFNKLAAVTGCSSDTLGGTISTVTAAATGCLPNSMLVNKLAAAPGCVSEPVIESIVCSKFCLLSLYSLKLNLFGGVAPIFSLSLDDLVPESSFEAALVVKLVLQLVESLEELARRRFCDDLPARSEGGCGASASGGKGGCIGGDVNCCGCCVCACV